MVWQGRELSVLHNVHQTKREVFGLIKIISPSSVVSVRSSLSRCVVSLGSALIDEWAALRRFLAGVK